MYRDIGTEQAPQRSRWSSSPPFRLYKCAHCGALLVLRESYEKPPKQCGKCHR